MKRYLNNVNFTNYQEQHIPIDIHIGKLLEWLISRRLVPKHWHTRIPEIRNKIANAVNDMPSHEELVKLLSGARKLAHTDFLRNVNYMPFCRHSLLSLFANHRNIEDN